MEKAPSDEETISKPEKARITYEAYSLVNALVLDSEPVGQELPFSSEESLFLGQIISECIFDLSRMVQFDIRKVSLQPERILDIKGSAAVEDDLLTLKLGKTLILSAMNSIFYPERWTERGIAILKINLNDLSDYGEALGFVVGEEEALKRRIEEWDIIDRKKQIALLLATISHEIYHYLHELLGHPNTAGIAFERAQKDGMHYYYQDQEEKSARAFSMKYLDSKRKLLEAKPQRSEWENTLLEAIPLVLSEMRSTAKGLHKHLQDLLKGDVEN